MIYVNMVHKYKPDECIADIDFLVNIFSKKTMKTGKYLFYSIK